jgi:hypothetical protein
MAVASVVRLTDIIAGDAWAQDVKITQSGADFTGFALDLEWDGSVQPVVTAVVHPGNNAQIDAVLSLASADTQTMAGFTASGRLKLSYPQLAWQTILRFTLRIIL